jgi:ATP adenylyltransferase
MDSLFGPWRMQFILEDKDADPAHCVLCEVVKTASDRDRLILHRGSHAYVILNLYPYNSGHLMVVPFRHVDCLAALTADERAECLALLAHAETVLAEVYKPQGFNVGANIGAVAGAGIPGHVHFHILPRWQGDTNFLPVLGQTKSLPETLEQTYDRLKAEWATS